MVFSSYSFIILFTPFLLSYYVARDRCAKFILVVLFSFLFLSYYGERHIILALLSALISFPALFIANKIYFRLTVACISLMLIIFKYHDFLNLKPVIQWILGAVNKPDFIFLYDKIFLVLPLGISFYTFQIIGALIDQSRLKWKISPVDWLAYVLFFPQLIAGPIVRMRVLLPQFSESHKLKFRNIYIGMQLFSIGFAKKILLADPLSRVTIDIWAHPDAYNGFITIAAIFTFYVQVYLDFSAYTDMGRGCARMMGYRLPINFRNPYFATTPAAFFERWHVSLSSWIRDYVHTPLSLVLTRKFGHRLGYSNSIYISAFLVMFIFGMWHGGGWNFAMFSLALGILVAGWYPLNAMIKLKGLPHKIMGYIWVQGWFIFSLIFFRADDVAGGFAMLKRVYVSDGHAGVENFYLIPVAILATFAIQYLDGSVIHKRRLARAASYLRSSMPGMALWSLLFVCAFAVKIHLDGGTEMIAVIDDLANPFIYFDF